MKQVIIFGKSSCPYTSRARDAYKLWLQTFQSPEPVPWTSADGRNFSNLRMYLKDESDRFMEDLQLSCTGISIDTDLPLVTLELRVTQNGQPVSGLLLSPAGADRADVPVIDGHAKAYIYSLPGSLKPK